MSSSAEHPRLDQEKKRLWLEERRAVEDGVLGFFSQLPYVLLESGTSRAPSFAG